MDATINLATGSTKLNSQGTTLSMGATTKSNSEEFRFPNDIGNYVDRPVMLAAHMIPTHSQ